MVAQNTFRPHVVNQVYLLKIFKNFKFKNYMIFFTHVQCFLSFHLILVLRAGCFSLINAQILKPVIFKNLLIITFDGVFFYPYIWCLYITCFLGSWFELCTFLCPTHSVFHPPAINHSLYQATKRGAVGGKSLATKKKELFLKL